MRRLRFVGIGGLVGLGGLVGVTAHRVANTEHPWSRPGATASTILQDPQWPAEFPITTEHLKRCVLLAHPPTHPLTHSLTHSLTRSVRCTLGQPRGTTHAAHSVLASGSLQRPLGSPTTAPPTLHHPRSV